MTVLNDVDNNVIDCSSSEQDCFFPLREYKKKYFKNLMLSYINLNSLTRCFSELSVLLCDNLVDFLSIGETKLDDSVLDSCISVNNYRVYRRDGSRLAHGILTYVRSDITHCRRTEFEYDVSGAQYIVIEFYVKKEKCFLVNVYKPPPVNNIAFTSELSMICDKLYCESDMVIIIGDMNIDMKNVDRSNAIVDFCLTYSLTNIVKDTTCYKSVENESMIDLILVSKPKRFNETIVYDTGLSDFHKMLCVTSKAFAPTKISRKIHYGSFKKFEEYKFIKEVSYIPFRVAFTFDDVNDISWCQERLFCDVVESHAPLKQRILRKESVPFMNSALRKGIHKRNQLRNKFWKNKTKENWNNYRAMRNKVTSMCRASEIRFFRSKTISSNTPSDFWKSFKPYVSSRINSNNNIVLKEDGKTVTKPKDICNIFKDYYSSIADEIGLPDPICQSVNMSTIEELLEEHKNHPSVNKIRDRCQVVNEFNFFMTTPDIVLKQIKNLNVKKICRV